MVHLLPGTRNDTQPLAGGTSFRRLSRPVLTRSYDVFMPSVNWAAPPHSSSLVCSRLHRQSGFLGTRRKSESLLCRERERAGFTCSPELNAAIYWSDFSSRQPVIRRLSRPPRTIRKKADRNFLCRRKMSLDGVSSESRRCYLLHARECVEWDFAALETQKLNKK